MYETATLTKFWKKGATIQGSLLYGKKKNWRVLIQIQLFNELTIFKIHSTYQEITYQRAMPPWLQISATSSSLQSSMYGFLPSILEKYTTYANF